MLQQMIELQYFTFYMYERTIVVMNEPNVKVLRRDDVLKLIEMSLLHFDALKDKSSEQMYQILYGVAHSAVYALQQGMKQLRWAEVSIEDLKFPS